MATGRRAVIVGELRTMAVHELRDKARLGIAYAQAGTPVMIFQHGEPVGRPDRRRRGRALGRDRGLVLGPPWARRLPRARRRHELARVAARGRRAPERRGGPSARPRAAPDPRDPADDRHHRDPAPGRLDPRRGRRGSSDRDLLERQVRRLLHHAGRVLPPPEAVPGRRLVPHGRARPRDGRRARDRRLRPPVPRRSRNRDRIGRRLRRPPCVRSPAPSLPLICRLSRA